MNTITVEKLTIEYEEKIKYLNEQFEQKIAKKESNHAKALQQLEKERLQREEEFKTENASFLNKIEGLE
jgi:hypothetical protein